MIINFYFIAIINNIKVDAAGFEFNTTKVIFPLMILSIIKESANIATDVESTFFMKPGAEVELNPNNIETNGYDEETQLVEDKENKPLGLNDTGTILSIKKRKYNWEPLVVEVLTGENKRTKWKYDPWAIQLKKGITWTTVESSEFFSCANIVNMAKKIVPSLESLKGGKTHKKKSRKKNLQKKRNKNTHKKKKLGKRRTITKNHKI